MKSQHSLKKSPVKAPAERVVKDIRRQTRRHFSAEDKIRIVLDGLRGEDNHPIGTRSKAKSVTAEIARGEAILTNFLEGVPVWQYLLKADAGVSQADSDRVHLATRSRDS